jgi:hypothetical protein
MKRIERMDTWSSQTRRNFECPAPTALPARLLRPRLSNPEHRVSVSVSFLVVMSSSSWSCIQLLW